MKNDISKQINITMYILEIVISVFAVTIFVLKSITPTLIQSINVSFVSLLTFFSIIFLGYRKNKNSILKDKISNIYVSMTILYLIIIFFLGNILGYKKIPLNILNTIYYFYIIILIEIFRYIFANKCNKKTTHLIILGFVLTLYDILVMSKFSPINPIFIGDFIPLVIISSIKNALLTYTTYKYGYRPCILYAIIIDIFPVVFPIYPDLTVYLKLIVTIIYSSIIFYNISKSYRREDLESASTYRKSVSFYVERISLVLVIIIILLVSGIFKFSMSAIASDSMYPALKKGDAIIIEEVTDKNINTIRKNMIVAFEEDGKIITHRIISIELEEGEEYIITKGDNNPSKDVTKKKKNDIIGIVRLRIPFLGYPSVEISEIKNKENK
ncbi:MAG: signal peptidase I [Candidatus Coprovivens sp.]